jgi:hypothetical protein
LAVSNTRSRHERNSGGRSSVGSFLRVCHDFGPLVALRVVYSKIRGILFPALALPDPPTYSNRRREVSILLSTTDHDAATLDAVVTIVSGRADYAWEICICERTLLERKNAALARLRGSQPWIHIVTADGSVDDAAATSWTIEQATGEYLAVFAPGYVPEGQAIASLIARLQKEPETDAAILIGVNSRSDCFSTVGLWANCRIVLQRKASYLAMQVGRWRLDAPALAKELIDTGVPIACICEGRKPCRQRT